ncbi:hypothetical protein KAFR_0A03180 [Kazachstania africana CBS 2517]|uniref:Zn(2)-C6 fungal-type domain-containing protein n=1 Tax=Kazachstania africana (strain ATCC 22294 / BCRC 22015 / CBS 2517 / CECT 1963 / NBRC 1671 / NRRL Y-8276) TaxID=1071382 RepID=H2AN03_KAZAF|nr:hypothetical protein KAFR_0A03180 [Kazachstania africana CBS 2517]CCF55753.1 hypothetical protein KAFR_0A03180 [Kazachstania africana CBS 2517]
MNLSGNTNQPTSMFTGSDGNTSSNMSVANTAARKRKFACVECRQQKSKCDAHERAPEPCSKCAKKGVPCVLKKDFRRTYKRARNEAIEEKFRELTKNLVNLTSSDEILKKIEEEKQKILDSNNFTKDKVKKQWRKNGSKNHVSPMSPYSSTPSQSLSPSVRNIPVHNFDYVHGMTEEQLQCTPKSLGDVYVSSEDIAKLFQEFATKYQVFLPVVDLTKGAERIYSLSPCLFWVILLIGLRRDRSQIKLMTRLSVLVKSVLAEIMISPIIRYTPSDKDEPLLNVASVYSVQAFLLYTFWPPLSSSLSADTSWNTIGTAMFQAVRVGLNSADFSKEYATANSELVNEQRRTWICCNIVSQIIASSFGFPAYISFDHAVMNSVKNINNNNNIPHELNQMIQIAHFQNQITKTLNSNSSNKLGQLSRHEKQSLLSVLNQQLSKLEVNLEESSYFDGIRKLVLLVSKVNLLSNYFFGSQSSEKDGSVDFETSSGLVKLYGATIHLLNHAYAMYQHDNNIIKYFPGVFVLNIWQCACIISKLVHSSLSSMLNVEDGRIAYQNAILLTYKASVLKHDMAYRSSGIMRSIWSLFNNMYQDWKKVNREVDENFNLDITVQSRMSVSVFFDCLYILKEKSGMAKLKRENGHHENNTSNLLGVEQNNNSSNDEDDDGNNSNTRNALVDEEHPEQKARRIIQTIPLDPDPISAGTVTSNSSKFSSPQTFDSHNENFSHLSKLHHDQANSEGDTTTTPSVIAPLSIDQLNNSMPGQGQIPSFDSIGNQILTYVPPIKHDAEDFHSDAVANSASPMSDRQGRNSKESPNSIMVNWDNWESDMVWKDVDILMNEFAFNPTL